MIWEIICELFGETVVVGQSAGGPDDGRLTYFTSHVSLGHTFNTGSHTYKFNGSTTVDGYLLFEYQGCKTKDQP